MSSFTAVSPIRVTVFFILLIAFFRFCAVFFPAFALQVDEAQYAGWANHLDYGYYSKPPFIAWMLHLSQAGCDVFAITHVEGCSRMLQSVALMIAGLFVMASAWQLFSDRLIALVSGLLFITLPSVAFYSLLATTDSWLLMWWSIGLFAFVIIMQTPMRWWPWALLGLALGFGVLAKYAMLAFLIGLIVAFVRMPELRHRGISRRLLLTLLIAALLLFPHYQWNAVLGFPTISHHVEIAQVPTLSEHQWQLTKALQSLVAFIGGQFVVFGPLALITLLMLIFGARRTDAQSLLKAELGILLWGFVAPMLLIMVVESLISRAFANWALVSYVAASILVAAYWVQSWKSKSLLGLSGRAAFISSLVIGLSCTVGFVAVPHWVQSNPALADVNHNPFRRIYGWKPVALWVKAYASQNTVTVAAQDRYLLATMAKYSYPAIDTPYAWNPHGVIKNHYHQFYDIANITAVEDPQTSVLLLLVGQPSELEIKQLHKSFSQVQPFDDAILAQFKVGKFKKPITAFTVSGFRGYSS